MANKFTEHRIIDSNKRALIKLTGLLDTEISNNVLIDVSSLAFALNSNNFIMSSNVHQKSAYRISLKRIFGDINLPGYLTLQWHGDSNNVTVVLGPTFAELDLDKNGINAVIPNNAANTNGDLLISTVGVVANCSYTLFIDLRKDSADYDAGQTRDPIAFNRGRAAP